MEKNIKKECAKEALKLIKTNTIVGLGGGSTIAYLIDFIKASENLNVKIVTPSMSTRLLCIQNGLEVLHTCSVDYIDIAFDGCNQVDENFHALKSGGAIHTKEKLISYMTNEYIILADESKFVKKLSFEDPITLEVFEDALAYVQKELTKLDVSFAVRKSTAKDGFTISDDGNLLIDVMFKNVKDSHLLEKQLNNISGVIDCSLFTETITKILVASNDEVKIISKN